MRDERQNLQLKLALHGAGEGEAQTRRAQGTESRVVKGVSENPATGRQRLWACLTRRTAVYGPVRTVVWEGRSREAPPYPNLENCNLNGMLVVIAE
jgi:hypothetical protein